MLKQREVDRANVSLHIYIIHIHMYFYKQRYKDIEMWHNLFIYIIYVCTIFEQEYIFRERQRDRGSEHK